jgi:long-chain acyl-CoA synthetase
MSTLQREDLARVPAPPDSPHSLPAVLLRRARETPGHVALRKKHLGVWRAYTWREYAERAAAIGAGLTALGVEPGDRVAVHAQNRPAWVIGDLGIQSIGGITVGIYPTSPDAEVSYLLGHSESVVLIAEDGSRPTRR